jgi:hypothetical protein
MVVHTRSLPQNRPPTPPQVRAAAHSEMVNQLKVQEQRLRFELGKVWRSEKEVCSLPCLAPVLSRPHEPSARRWARLVSQHSQA